MSSLHQTLSSQSFCVLDQCVHATMAPSETVYCALQPAPPKMLPQFAPTSACFECRRKKTRCDMRRPVCGLCARTGTSCDFPVSRKRPSRPASKGPEKIQKVEHQLSKLIRLLEESPNRGQPEQDRSDQQPQPTPATPTSQATPGAEGDNSINFNSAHSPASQTFLAAEDAPSGPHSVTSPALPVALEPRSSTVRPVSYDLAMHLVDLYFDKIQPWLPLLHKPRFLRICAQTLRRGPDSLGGLGQTDSLVFLGLFSLAARYCDREWLGSLLPRIRGDDFLEQARSIYSRVRDLHEPSLRCLQGGILLAFAIYTSEVSSFGWVLVGVCIRWVYDLGLAKLDYERSPGHGGRDWVQQEELRRAWWLVWELDTFGSIVLLRPFAIDRRHVYVKMPISDEAWFNEESVESEIPILQKRLQWKALRTSANQDARSWFLVANIVLSQIYDRLLLGESLKPDQRVAFANDIQCFRLSVPHTLRLQVGGVSMSNSAAVNNWVIGAHLLLTAASFMLDILPGERDESGQGEPDTLIDLSSRQANFLIKRSQILGVWPPDCLETAHPFFICTILPLFAQNCKDTGENTALRSCNDLIELIHEGFAQHWELGEAALRKYPTTFV